VLPYGLSKGLTWQVFRYYAEAAGVPLGKFVIPNPFGPYEEPRFTAYLMRTWREGKIAEVRTPDYVRDNIHVDLLGQAYRACAERLVAGSAKVMRFNPSGYAGSQGAFAQRYAQEMRARLGWACELALARQTDFAEPLERVNTEPATQWAPNWDEGKAWDGVAEYYRNGVA
jgi:nucleoside-diphosphate-sugar epimerase